VVGFAVGVAIALCFAACGGGSDEAGSSGSTSNPAVTGQSSAGAAGPTSGNGAGKAAEESSPQHPRSEAEERAAYERKRYGPPSRRSAGFRASSKRGVLKHLPEFGSEASAGGRNEAQATLAAYLGATGAGDWSEACKYLLPYYVATLEASARAATGAPRDCAETLPALFKQAAEQPGPKFPDTQAPRVASLRVEAYPQDRAAELELNLEQAGFALLHGSDGEDYYMSMTREGGKWKLTMPMPRPLG